MVFFFFKNLDMLAVNNIFIDFIIIFSYQNNWL